MIDTQEYPETVIGVHFLLPPQINEIIRQSTRQFQTEDIRANDLPLHITLGFCVIPKEKFDMVCVAMKLIRTHPVSVTPTEITNSPYRENKNFYCSLKLSYNCDLYNLHESVLDKLNG